jgi:hypothetical protein
LEPGRRASAGGHRHRYWFFFLFIGQEFFYGLFVKFIGLTFNYFKGADGAFAQAGPQSVTIQICDHFGLTVYNLQGAFSAGRNTIAATITQFFIDFYYFA